MNKDLSEFYILSSHNTYCKRYQVESPSHLSNIGVEPYLYILDRFKGGCVEIDVVGSVGDDMSVFHGCIPGAGCFNPLKLSDVLKAIIEWSVGRTSKKRVHYPIIISLDLKKTDKHCVEMLDKVFQECFAAHEGLLYPPVKNSYKPYVSKLTLQDTHNKILLRINTNVVSHLRFLKHRVAMPYSPKNSLSYNNLVPMKTLNGDKVKYQRAYPSPLYIFSHNFDPIPFWERRVQMVALNFQRNDEFTYIYERLFKNRPFIHMSEWNDMKTKIEKIRQQYNMCELPAFKFT